MTMTVPIVLPSWLVETYGIDLSLTTGQTACSVETLDVTFSSSGEMTVCSDVFRAGPLDAADRDQASVGCNLIARYDSQGEPLDVLVTGLHGPDAETSSIPRWRRGSLCALPDGNIAVARAPDRTYVIAADFGSVLAAYEPRDQFVPDSTDDGGVATWMRTTPNGRLLCAVGEDCADMFRSFERNLLAVGDAAALASTHPVLEVIAAIAGPHERVNLDTTDHRPHVFYRGAPLTVRNRPREPINQQLQAWVHLDRRVGYYDRGPYLMSTPEPLADDLFVLPIFNEFMRGGGGRGFWFGFCLVDDTGELVGILRGMDLEADSPYPGGKVRIATDPPRCRVFHLNRNGLYAWCGGDWELRAKVSTADRPFTLLKQFDLMGCSPEGDVVLVHQKQHLLLKIPVPDDLAGLDVAVADALATFAKERSALKKRYNPNNWYWTATPDEVPLHFL